MGFTKTCSKTDDYGEGNPKLLLKTNSWYYPITTSSTIIRTKPMAKPMVLRFEC